MAEAALLTVGVEPRTVDYTALFRSYNKDTRTDEVLYFLEDRFEEIARGLDIEPITESPVPIDRLVHWILSTDTPTVPLFRQIFRRQFERAKKAPGLRETTLHHFTESMLQRVIVTMAVENHGLLSEDDIGRVAKEIQNAGQMIGSSLSHR